MGAINQLQVPLVGVGGVPPYVFSVITGASTTIPATVSEGVLSVDATSLEPGTYSVEVRITDQEGNQQTVIIPVDVVDPGTFSIRNRDLSYSSSSLSTSITFTPEVSLLSIGGTGTVTWSILPLVTTLPGASISGATLSLPLPSIGQWTVGLRATDSIGNTVTRLLTIVVEQAEVVALVDGDLLLQVSPDAEETGQHQFSATVTDSASISVKQTFNYTVNPPISQVDIADTAANHVWRASDSASLVLPIGGNLSGFTIGGFSTFVAPNGLSVSFDDTTNSLVVEGPPASFQNSEVSIPIAIMQGGVQVATVTREFTLVSNGGTSGMGSLTCYTRPYIVGELVGLDPQRPYFNSPDAFKTTGYTVQLAAGNALPQGLSLDSTTGLVYGNVLNDDVAQSVLLYLDSTGIVQASITIVWDILVGSFQLTDNLPQGQSQVSYSGTITTSSAAAISSAMVVHGTLPAGLTLGVSTDGTAITLTGTPTVAGYFDLWIQVLNSNGFSAYIYKRLVIDFIVPLVITTAGLQSPITSVAFSQTLAAVGGVTPYTWALTSGALPTGLTLNVNSGVISGTPTDSTYSQTITLRVTDQRGVAASRSFLFALNDTLTIVTPVLPVVIPSQLYQFQVAAQGGVPGYTWSLASGSAALPEGVTLSSSGVLFGATSLESYSENIIIQVRDSVNTTATHSFLLQTGVPTVLEINTSGVGLVPHGGPYFGSLKVFGGTAPYSWSLGPNTPNALPTGLTLSADSGGTVPTATISGSSTATLANYSIEVQAVDSLGNQAVAFVLLNSASTLAITTTSLPQATVGGAYSVQFAATGFNPPFTWSVDPSSPALPAGMTLSSTGLLSGTPTVVGTVYVVIRATDELGDYTTATLPLAVVASTLAITTTSLPGATAGVMYVASLVATGGSTPYRWSISPSSAYTFPPGIQFDVYNPGRFYGVTLSAGFSNPITFRVTDNLGVYREVTLTLTVASGLNLVAGPDWVQGTSTGYLGMVGQGDPTSLSASPNFSFCVIAENCVSTSTSQLVPSIPSGYSATVVSLTSGTAVIRLSGPFNTGALGSNSFNFSISDSGVNGSKQFQWNVYAEQPISIVTQSGGALPTLTLD